MTPTTATRCSPTLTADRFARSTSATGFRTLVKQLGLPPIRLHDLRHGAATVALAAHADLKVIQHMLGHASIVMTADTYTSVLPEVAHSAAQASADLIMKVARSAPWSRRQETGLPHESVRIDESG